MPQAHLAGYATAFVAHRPTWGPVVEQAGGWSHWTFFRGFSPPMGIALDGAGNVYTTGRHGGTVDFDPGTGTYTLAAGAFVWKLNGAGDFVGGGLSREAGQEGATRTDMMSPPMTAGTCTPSVISLALSIELPVATRSSC